MKIVFSNEEFIRFRSITAAVCKALRLDKFFTFDLATGWGNDEYETNLTKVIITEEERTFVIKTKFVLALADLIEKHMIMLGFALGRISHGVNTIVDRIADDVEEGKFNDFLKECAEFEKNDDEVQK